MICTPKSPKCDRCPVADLCRANASGTQEDRPVKRSKKGLPGYIHAAGVIVRRGKVLMTRRPSEGLLGGMWEFPNGRVDGDPAGELSKTLKAGYRLNVRKKEPLGVFHHAYSHFKVAVHVYRCDLSTTSIADRFKWIPLKELGDHPMGKIDRQIARRLSEFLESN